MCGISAIWTDPAGAVSPSCLRALARSQVHRGPDGHGYALWNTSATTPHTWYGRRDVEPDLPAEPFRVGLAHNLLAIQDMSEHGFQPMRRGRHWIAFNGEIYNFRELRVELVAKGEEFAGQSDTEVLLALWAREGPAALDRLRGMFAFVIYDSQADELWAVRDRFGIKPLYYAEPPAGGVVVASEFRGLHASGLVGRSWNEGAVRAFLAAAVNKPADDLTFFEGVKELPPGCWIRFRHDGTVLERYYDLPGLGSPWRGEESLAELREGFLEVIDQHLRSVREVGMCLSGGLDSSNIAAAIARSSVGSNEDFKTFSIEPRDTEEVRLAAEVAQRLSVEHHVIPAPAGLRVEDLADMVVACETPNHYWGPINHYLLLRSIARQHEVPVLLNGQGGDEALSGYPWFLVPVVEHLRRHLGSEPAEELRAAAGRRNPLPDGTGRTTEQIYFSRRKWIARFDDGALDTLGATVDEVAGWPECRYYLNDDLDWGAFRRREFYRRELQHLLRHEDRLGMWFSIESRVPFLDHQLVELLGTLAPDWLFRGGYLKYPLRVLFPELPERVRFNTTKRGFWEVSAPLSGFEVVARRAILECDLLSSMVDERRVDRLGTMALWRFFQIALLDVATDRGQVSAWTRSHRSRAGEARSGVAGEP